ncbi:hypothetical protein GA0061102_100924 [Rhizobium miluonense]|uniref:Uncharacterized protein n=1 Tax=Rhizobium miluonense TaxID=411945 RepID=A0A1C3V608_9HYPH|nr:hypothetical protein GA0061102_100924 [Rhizobium miluonense]
MAKDFLSLLEEHMLADQITPSSLLPRTWATVMRRQQLARSRSPISRRSCVWQSWLNSITERRNSIHSPPGETAACIA